MDDAPGETIRMCWGESASLLSPSRDAACSINGASIQIEHRLEHHKRPGNAERGVGTAPIGGPAHRE